MNITYNTHTHTHTYKQSQQCTWLQKIIQSIINLIPVDIQYWKRENHVLCYRIRTYKYKHTHIYNIQQSQTHTLCSAVYPLSAKCDSTPFSIISLHRSSFVCICALFCFCIALGSGACVSVYERSDSHSYSPHAHKTHFILFCKEKDPPRKNLY